MTTPNVLPAGFVGSAVDFTKCKVDHSGAVRQVQGSITVPNATAANAYVGLVPFQAGARFILNDKSIYAGNFGAGTTTLNVGIIYDDNVTNTNDVDAFASLSTAPQSGGFVSIDEIEGMTLVTTGNGWLAAQLIAAAADADAAITYNVGVAYDK